jgi:hypothetical protein
VNGVPCETALADGDAHTSPVSLPVGDALIGEDDASVGDNVDADGRADEGTEEAADHSSGGSTKANDVVAATMATTEEEEEAAVAAIEKEKRRRARGPSTWALVLRFCWQDVLAYVAAVAFSAATAVLSISEASIMKSLFDSFSSSRSSSRNRGEGSFPSSSPSSSSSSSTDIK